VLFLNNDTVVTAGWLDALVCCIETAPDAGLVGAKLVYPDGRLQEAGGIVFDDASGWNYGRFEDPTDPRYSFRREVDYCSGAAILLRRDLFERLGRFDARYAPAYYEDTDLAFAVRAAGLKVYVEPASVVVHFEGITSGTDTASGTKRYQVVNREKFLDKWKDALARQPKPGTPIGVAATHRAKKRVLIIDATTPMPDHDSGSLRMVNLMRVLGDLGCQTSFMPENRVFVERYTPALQALGVEALYAPYAQDPVKFLRERGGEFDLVILSRHYVAAPFAGLVRLYAPRARLVFDTVDLHYLREQRAAELERRRARAHGRGDARTGAQADPRQRRHARGQPGRTGTARTRCAWCARGRARTCMKCTAANAASPSASTSSSSAASSIRRTWTRSNGSCARSSAACAPRFPNCASTSSAAACQHRSRRSRANTSSCMVSLKTSCRSWTAAASRSRRCATARASRARSTWR
jgi:hypothetical protein